MNEALGEVACQFGLDDPERHEAWSKRLAEDSTVIEPLRRTELRGSSALVTVENLCQRTSESTFAERDTHTEAVARGPAPHSEPIEARVRAALAQIRNRSELNAFVEVFDAEALHAAQELDRRIARGEQLGPMGGCLVAVKDLIDVKGYRTTGGTRALQSQPAEWDAPAVARLREADAVIVGTTNLHALAYGALSTSSDFGVVGNPLRQDAVAGGSSGGSAAAVSAGLVDIALGTDTAGSIRIPSSLCGVVGLKPTYGRVPTRGVQPLGPSLDHVGPITRTVAEASFVLEVISDQPFTAQSTRWHSLENVVIALPDRYFCDRLEAQVREALDSAVSAIRELGGRVRHVDIPSVGLSPAAQLCTLSCEAFDVHRELLVERGDMLPEDVRLRLEVGMFRTGPDYVRAQRIRAILQAEMDRALRDADLLLVPTLPITAPPKDASHVDVDGERWTTQFAVTRLTMPFNLTGFPALTLPWSSDSHGGGIGIQLAAAPMAEATLLGAAHAMELHRGTSIRTDG